MRNFKYSIETTFLKLKGLILVSLIIGFSLYFNSCQQNPDVDSESEAITSSEGTETEILTEESDSIIDAIAFKEVEVKPEFPGGEPAIKQFLMEHTVYPEKALEEGIQGVVLVEFTIDKEGEVTQPKIKNAVSPELDAEALRVISKMPDWTPGEHGGKKVKVKFKVPLNFNLE